MLAGKAVCGRCGTLLEGRSGTGRNKTVYFYYVCRRPGCRLRVGAGEIEEAVLQRLAMLAENTDLITALVAETNRRLQRRAPVLAKQQRATERQLAQVKAQADALLNQREQLEREHGRAFITDRLGALGQRREELGGRWWSWGRRYGRCGRQR